MQTDIIDNNNLIIIENSKMDQATQFHQKLSKIPNFNLNIRFPLNRTIIINNDTQNEGIYSLDIFINLACIIPRNYNIQNFEKDYKIITTFLIKSIKLLNIDFNIVNAIGYKIYSYTPPTFNGQKITKTFFGDTLPFECIETCKQLQFDNNFNLIQVSQPNTFSNTNQFGFGVTNQPFSNQNVLTPSTVNNPFMNSSQPFGNNPFSISNVSNGLNNQQPFGNNIFTPNTQPINSFGNNGSMSTPAAVTGFNTTPFIFKP